ncbi:hypothetical protein NMG60_11019068 [Bertholletia excelsa]
MGETREEQMQIVLVEETKETSPIPTNENANYHPAVPLVQKWLKIGLYSLFGLSGASVATLLGSFYFEKGGKSKWVAALVQFAGFVILLPFLLISPKRPLTEEGYQRPNKPSAILLTSIYLSFGVFQAGGSLLSIVGLQYLPASTYSLVSASQLAFTALFSFFINAQKLTPFIINSLVVLLISSVLLVVNTSSSGSSVSKGKYILGFLCTVAASASAALMVNLAQLFYRKVLKKATFGVIIKLIIYQSLIASCAMVVGLFASGEWKGLRKEMDDYESGKVSYVMTLVWTAICWQLSSIGSVGLIFNVSSLFSSVITTLTIPIVPVGAAIFLHDKMNGIKVMSLLLAIWGFVSYMYQHYLEDFKSRNETASVAPEDSSNERC